MIVISGALVLVALVLLVLGLTMTDLQFVYGSIGVSLVSFVFLVIGILQRRGEPAPASPQVSEDGSSSPAGSAGEAPAASASGRSVPQSAPAATAVPAKTGATGSVAVVVDDDVADDELEPGGGPVLIVEGRPRYHVEGCRYLTGKQAEELDVLDARDDGFSPCGVCKPDQVLEELYGELPLDQDDVDDVDDEVDDDLPSEDDVLDTGVPGAGDDEPAPARARRSRGSVATTAAVPVPAPAAEPAAERPAAKAPASRPAKAAKPAKAATAALPVAAEAALPAGAPPAKAASRTKVVVIPERDRFHTPSCRFVKGVAGTESLTRTQAGKQGFQACGVCKP